MAIALGTAVLGAANSVAGNYDTAITPAATPNGVVVIIIDSTSTGDVVTSVVYGTGVGAVPLSRAATPYGFATEATEPGGVYIYWAGDSVMWPTGAQTVRITRTGTDNLRAMIATMTVAVGQTVTLDGGAIGTSASMANPSWAHSSLAANVLAFLGIHSGLQAMTTTPATNWALTPAGSSEDVGAIGRGWASRTLATPGALAPGWIAATADDFVGSSIAFQEAPVAATPLGPRWARGIPAGERHIRPAITHSDSR
jgi:hypothetical protein